MKKLSCILCTAILLIGCGKRQPENETHSVFFLNLYAGLSSLDPAFAGDQASTWMCLQLYNGLVQFDSALGLQPAIAHSWQWDSNLTRLTFHLRRDVWFHPHDVFGPAQTRRVTAGDFVYSFTRLCDPAVASPGLSLFNGEVQGVTEFNEQKTPTVNGFYAPDDSTFVIQLVQPFSPFLNLLAMPMASVVPREAVEKFGKEFRKHPVGTGPFQFFRWTEGVSLILHKNPRYFEKAASGEPLPHLDALKVRFIRNRVTEFMELMQGRLHMVNYIDPSLRKEVFSPGKQLKEKYARQFHLLTGPYLNTEFLAFQLDSSLDVVKDHPLRMKKLRQALAHAIDREAMVKYLLHGFGQAGVHGLVPAGMPGYPFSEVQGYPYDPARCAQLLNEAGFPGGKGLPILHLHSQPAYQPAMEFVQKSWEQAGIWAQIDNTEGPVLRKMAAEGAIALWRGSWIADYPDPQNYLALLYSANIPPAGANRFRYRSARADSLYQAAVSQSKPMTDWAAMDQQAMNDAVLIPLYYDQMVTLVSKTVSGLEMNAMNQPSFKRVRLHSESGS